MTRDIRRRRSRRLWSAWVSSARDRHRTAARLELVAADVRVAARRGRSVTRADGRDRLGAVLHDRAAGVDRADPTASESATTSREVTIEPPCWPTAPSSSRSADGRLPQRAVHLRLLRRGRACRAGRDFSVTQGPTAPRCRSMPPPPSVGTFHATWNYRSPTTRSARSCSATASRARSTCRGSRAPAGSSSAPVALPPSSWSHRAPARPASDPHVPAPAVHPEREPAAAVPARVSSAGPRPATDRSTVSHDRDPRRSTTRCTTSRRHVHRGLDPFPPEPCRIGPRTSDQERSSRGGAAAEQRTPSGAPRGRARAPCILLALVPS